MSAQYNSFFLDLLNTLIFGDPKGPCFKKTDIGKLELAQIIKVTFNNYWVLMVQQVYSLRDFIPSK